MKGDITVRCLANGHDQWAIGDLIKFRAVHGIGHNQFCLRPLEPLLDCLRTEGSEQRLVDGPRTEGAKQDAQKFGNTR